MDWSFSAFFGSPKIFCIGRNKTGTTSLRQSLQRIGFSLGHQPSAENLLEDWGRRDFRRIISYCRSADAFQDIPFSLDFTYQAVDASFPGSKFILTVRSSSEEWYDSLVRFHTKILNKQRLPTANDLQQHPYRETGWLWRCQQLVYGVDESTLYDRDSYIGHYEQHNANVIRYFQNRPDALLVLNLSDGDSMQRLCKFLNKDFTSDMMMPHLNQSAS